MSNIVPQSPPVSGAMQFFAADQVPAAFHSLMSQMQGSELSQNVGQPFAVVSIKGKVFRIKHGGSETPITIDFNGQQYAAPYYDVVIPIANAALSKTWYPTGYTEGSDESPKCWSEDGVTPLAPLEDRPLMANGQPANDCRNCPMNVFGSKINETTGAKGKACADTRKLVIVPVDAAGNVDTENAKYGGPMLLRVPAASLAAFAEYDRKLQSMGVPYFAVVTRLEFDQTVAYPKFSLKPVRVVTEAEAQSILALRGDAAVQHILGGQHTSGAPVLAAPTATPVPAQAPATAAPVASPTPMPVETMVAPSPAPVQAAPVQQAPAFTPPAAPAPVQTAPVQQAPAFAPQAAPVAAYEPPAAPVQTAPAPVQAAPVQQAPAFAPPAAPAPVQAAPAAFPGFPPTEAAPAPVQQAAPAQTAPAATVTPELLGRIDQLLDS